ncbi:Spo0E family sporulation regulatory protein-aspartic acid phosphatase [Cohnella sp. GCM10027633]|uniref:Spo0E family sporulation regulatory protein-aspartic acid phosphatase n=1 Tax=unclassified Cohnella TaxID=2636738 RepID=UPI003634932C
MLSQANTEAHLIVYPGGSVLGTASRSRKYDGRLSEEIDRLRQRMADTFMRELSLTADPVMEISRELDDKINEYMKHVARA